MAQRRPEQTTHLIEAQRALIAQVVERAKLRAMATRRREKLVPAARRAQSRIRNFERDLEQVTADLVSGKPTAVDGDGAKEAVERLRAAKPVTREWSERVSEMLSNVAD